MRFFLDENFPKSATTWLSELGHEVFDVRGSEREGMPDNELFQISVASMHHNIF